MHASECAHGTKANVHVYISKYERTSSQEIHFPRKMLCRNVLHKDHLLRTLVIVVVVARPVAASVDRAN